MSSGIAVWLSMNSSKFRKGMDEAAASAEAATRKMQGSFDHGTSKIGGSLSKLSNFGGSFGLPFTGSLDRIAADFDKAKLHGNSFKAAMASSANLASTGVLGGFILAAGESVRLALKLESSQSALATAIHNAGSSWNAQADAIDKTETKMHSLAFSSEDTYQALTMLTTATGSYAKAQAYLGHVADLARLRHIGLTDAAQMYVRIMSGSGARILKQLGINKDFGNGAATKLTQDRARIAALQKQIAADLGPHQASHSGDASRARAAERYNRLLAERKIRSSSVAQAEFNLSKVQSWVDMGIDTGTKATTELARANAKLQAAKLRDLKYTYQIQNAQAAMNAGTARGVDWQAKAAITQAKLAAATQQYNKDLASTGEAVKAVNKIGSGAAQAFANTPAGKIQAMKESLIGLGEKFGKELLPYVERGITDLSQFLGWVNKNKTSVDLMAGSLLGAAAAIKLFNLGKGAVNVVKSVFSIGADAASKAAITGNTSATVANTEALLKNIGGGALGAAGGAGSGATTAIEGGIIRSAAGAIAEGLVVGVGAALLIAGPLKIAQWMGLIHTGGPPPTKSNPISAPGDAYGGPKVRQYFTGPHAGALSNQVVHMNVTAFNELVTDKKQLTSAGFKLSDATVAQLALALAKSGGKNNTAILASLGYHIPSHKPPPKHKAQRAEPHVQVIAHTNASPAVIAKHVARAVRSSR